VSGYGDELLSYLRDHTKLFPTTHGEKTFRRKAFAVGIGITSEILNNDRFKQAADDKVKAVEFRALIGEFGIRIDEDPLVQPVTADEISHALSKRYRFLAFLAEQPVRLTGQARSIHCHQSVRNSEFRLIPSTDARRRPAHPRVDAAICPVIPSRFFCARLRRPER
jgi:hypothetical protein